MRQFDETLLRGWVATVDGWRNERPAGCWLGASPNAVPKEFWRFDFVYGKRVTDNLLRLLMMCLEARVMPRIVRPNFTDSNRPLEAMVFFSCSVPWRPADHSLSFWVWLLTDGSVSAMWLPSGGAVRDDFVDFGRGFPAVRTAFEKLQYVLKGEVEGISDEPVVVQS